MRRVCAAPLASPRAGVYARISHDADGGNLGVTRQEADCRALIERRGWRVADVYVDNDLSAYSGALRPAYERLLADVSAGHLDVIVVWHPDRLHRQPVELETFIDLIERAGVAVETITSGEVDLASPSGRMHARMMGAVARYESEHRSERIRRKARELAETGKVGGGGRRPFGYEADRRTLRPDEADLIRTAASRVLSGDSLYAIAADWNSQGIATVTGARWSTTAIKSFLVRPRVAGLREHKGEIVADAEWPAVLDRATWHQVQSLLTDPARRINRRTRKYLLSGLLRCGRCGHPLVGTPRTPKHGTGKRGVYLYGQGATQRAYGCVKANGGCGGVFVVAEPVEAFVADLVIRRLSGAGLYRARRRLERGSARATTLLSQVEASERFLADLGRDYADRLIARPAFLAAQATEQAKMDGARRAFARSNRSLALDAVSDIASEWSELGPDRQRSILDAVLAEVRISPATGARNRFDPNRVEPQWIG